MCGIFGYIGYRNAVPIILKGLQRLEYRGYDSAGLAISNGRDEIALRKCKGKVKELVASLQSDAPSGVSGLGHTRWATHGIPDHRNAHPHLNQANRIAVVHNGIIENYYALKSKLEKEGYVFRSDTDSEVIVHLVDKYYRPTRDLADAVRKTLKEVRGTYAVAVLHQDEPNRIVASRRDSPLIIGLGQRENFVSSDIPAVLDYTDRIVTLENGDLISMDAKEITVWDERGVKRRRVPRRITWNIEQAEKGGFDHFMLKEIFDQPKVLADLIGRRIQKGEVSFEELKIPLSAFRKIKRVMIIACGTSYHAGLVGKYLFEELTPFSVSVDTSSEFRYRNVRVDSKTLVIVISQSGETADTLAALREANKRSALTLAICNVLGGTIAREAKGVVYTYAGPEIAVASTKAYTAQLGVLSLLALFMRSRVFGKKDVVFRRLVKAFQKVPRLIQEVLDDYSKDKANWDRIVHQFNKRYHEQIELYMKRDPKDRKRAPNGCFLYLGRNVNFPSALEGALKLKEISYISAEGYPAGEMKHGPIALIDENPWVICIAVQSKTYDKMISNIQEIRARGGIVTAIMTKGDTEIRRLNLFSTIEVPDVEELLSPLVVAIPLQLIAYSVAKEFGEEIDQPRNLAKSVTVE